MVDRELQYDVAVIGAGPAGIMAAIFAARGGARVVLLEKNDQTGRKILATGNGRCNLTNKNIELSRYHGQDVGFTRPIFSSFDQVGTMKFFEDMGVVLKEEDRGRIFPRTNQATTVTEALSHELQELGVEIKLGFTVKSIQHNSDWTITNDAGAQIFTRSLILTTGGKAAHQFGSSGDGLFWAKNLGHTIVPIHAALAPIEVSEPWVSELMGIKLTAKVQLLANDELITRREGDIIFTHFGISGPAVMGLAREVDPIIEAKQVVQISIDLLPDITSEKLDSMIVDQIAANSKKLVSSIIAGFVPKNLVPRILSFSGIMIDTKAAEISKASRRNIIGTLKDFRLTVTKVRPLKEAQVTAGGVSTAEVDATLQSKIVPTLYFAGEILDIDGDSGGFNLQWAWSSGAVAGQGAAKEVK